MRSTLSTIAKLFLCWGWLPVGVGGDVGGVGVVGFKGLFGDLGVIETTDIPAWIVTLTILDGPRVFLMPRKSLAIMSGSTFASSQSTSTPSSSYSSTNRFNPLRFDFSEAVRGNSNTRVSGA